MPGAVYFGFVIAIGMLVRTRRDFQRTQRDQATREAVSDERTRIAREMHDIIGHNLAVINALADGGAYAAEAAPEQAKEALRRSGAPSREALGELRRVLSVLKRGRRRVDWLRSRAWPSWRRSSSGSARRACR